MALKGKTAVITGGTSGIGAACAAALADQGATLLINGFGEADAIETQLDALSRASGESAYHSGADLGNVDILFNNAGIQYVCPVESFPLDKWRQMQAIMVDAPFLLSRAFVPGMKDKGWGRIISTASAHGSVASPNKAPYIVAKHGVLGLMRALGVELAQTGITANAISPGYVWTALIENQIPDTMRTRNMSYDEVINDVLLAAIPQKKFVMPEQIAAMVVFLCSDAASAMTGADIAVDGGWTAQ
jgi:3-hydroxybutyrate dehydrogenase